MEEGEGKEEKDEEKKEEAKEEAKEPEPTKKKRKYKKTPLEVESSVARMTRQQREEADQLSQAVREAEDALREANENEMPENALRETLAAKRKILNDFMEQVAAANMQKVGGAPGM